MSAPPTASAYSSPPQSRSHRRTVGQANREPLRHPGPRPRGPTRSLFLAERKKLQNVGGIDGLPGSMDFDRSTGKARTVCDTAKLGLLWSPAGLTTITLRVAELFTISSIAIRPYQMAGGGARSLPKKRPGPKERPVKIAPSGSGPCQLGYWAMASDSCEAASGFLIANRKSEIQIWNLKSLLRCRSTSRTRRDADATASPAPR